jgi:hypothetical protein
LNSKNKGNSKYPTSLSINEKGVPICIGGHEMIYNGFEKSRSRVNALSLACKKINHVLVLTNARLRHMASNIY